MKTTSKSIILIIALVIFILSIGAVYLLETFKPQPEQSNLTPVPPTVETLSLHKTDITLIVTTQGTVIPRTETKLVAEVSGKVLKTSPSFEDGGFFEENDILVKIDPRDYEVAVIQAQAEVAKARAALSTEIAEAEQALKDWKKLGQGEPSDLVLRKPQLARAEAELESAKAAHQKAKDNLDRTQIKAPYPGRVRNKTADVGQYVSPGSELGTVYAVDYAEVRLPLSDKQLAFLDIPLSYHQEKETSHFPEVTLHAFFAGKEHQWKGKIIRTEGTIDPKSRLLYAIARVEDPYEKKTKKTANRPPLAVGLFVEAHIQGKTINEVVRIPRTALFQQNKISLIDSDNRLKFQEIHIIRSEKDSVIIRGNFSSGDRISITPLEAPIEGMQVSIIPSNEPSLKEENTSSISSTKETTTFHRHKQE